jgi:LPXTG-motif cell wall-anchored protein
LRSLVPSARRLTTLVGAAFVGLAATAMFASPASAHHVDVTGKSDCVDGKWKVTWTVKDIYNTEATLDAVDVTPANAPIKSAAGVVLGQGVKIQSGDANNFVGVQWVGATERSASLRVSAHWESDGTTWAMKRPYVVELEGDCKPTESTPSPKPTPTGGTGGGVGTPTPSKTSAAPTLPVTGAQTGILTGGAVALLGAGAGLFVMARRRRIKFEA